MRFVFGERVLVAGLVGHAQHPGRLVHDDEVAVGKHDGAFRKRSLVELGPLLALVERLVAEDPRNVENAAMASDIEYRGGRYERAIELARESIAADARLPAEARAGLIVRENVVGAKRSLGASACALSERGSQPRPLRVALVKEGHSLLLESRAFERELVERGIDAREAASAIREIDADLKRCNEAIARLGPA